MADASAPSPLETAALQLLEQRDENDSIISAIMPALQVLVSGGFYRSSALPASLLQLWLGTVSSFCGESTPFLLQVIAPPLSNLTQWSN
jgi:hypothetical protein